MFESRFIRKPTSQPIKPKGDGCKIKIKNTAKGREIEFSEGCTREDRKAFLSQELDFGKKGSGEEDD